jgi:hypothetical protein
MTDVREAAMFKQVADGYVFRAPNPWVFGRTRFYLADESQKARLLAIVKSRSPAVFWIALVGLIAASTALIAFGTAHDDPTTGDVAIMIALLPVWLYGALLISIYPMARRLQPILAALPPTEQRITAVDLRQAMRKTMSFTQCLLLGISQGIMSAALVVLVLAKTDGGRVFASADGGVLSSAFAAAAFAIAAISFLVAAVGKARNPDAGPQDGGIAGGNMPAKRSFTTYLPIFTLVVSIGLLAFVVTVAYEKHERAQASALIQSRMASLNARMDGADIRGRQENLRARIDANNARVAQLIGRLNSPTVKCETAAATDDAGRRETIEACRERARTEQDTIQHELAAEVKTTAALKEEGEAIGKENEAFRTEIEAIRKDIQAMRR